MTQINLDLPVVGGDRDAWAGKLNAALTSLEGGHNAHDTALAGKVDDADLADAIVGLYTKPSGGIPKTDLAASVQTSLGKADSALQSVPAGYVSDTELATSLAGYQPVGAYASAADLDNVFGIATDARDQVQFVTAAEYAAGPKTAGVLYVVAG